MLKATETIVTRKTMLLNTAALYPRAFENKGGWKMDADGKLVLDNDGNPIFVNAAGQEQSVQGDTITKLNSEAKQHRTAKETAEAALAKFSIGDGKMIDPEVAKKAIETVSKLDAKSLIDAGEVDRVKETIKGEFTGQIAELQKTIESLTGENNTLKIDKVFDGSDYIKENVDIPGDMVRAYFGKNIKVENGETVVVGADGNRLFSKKNQGEYAKADEGLQLLIESHPQKDRILKANLGEGTGNGGGGGARGAGRTMKRDAFEKLQPTQAAEAAANMAKGELTIVD